MLIFIFLLSVVRRKTIYEYHRIDKMGVKIEGDTAIWFKAQPTCNRQKNCMDCIDMDGDKCQWCPKVNRCSNGMDRKRQDWLLANCDSYNAKTMEQCNSIGTLALIPFHSNGDIYIFCIY